MQLQITNMTEADLAEMDALDDKAMKDNPITQVIAINMPKGAPRGPFFQQYVMSMYERHKDTLWKATDSETGKIVGFALFVFERAVKDPEVAPKDTLEQLEEPPPDDFKKMMGALWADSTAFAKEHYKDKPHGSKDHQYTSPMCRPLISR